MSVYVFECVKCSRVGFLLAAVGMSMLQWCMLGVTILLLVCEIIISQLCNSLIILADGFHTLFILMQTALTSQTASINPPLSSSDSPASHLHASSSSAAHIDNLPAESSIKPLQGTQATTDGSTLRDQTPTPPKTSPPALSCGLSYTTCRIQAVGGFLSALLLASLSLSGIVEVISLFLGPKPVQRPLLLVVVSIGSLVHKMLMLWLNWDQQQASETESPPEMNLRGNFTEWITCTL